MKQRIHLIFDIGKTNKKCLVFSIHGELIEQHQEQFIDIYDDDSFPCEDLGKLTQWIRNKYDSFQKNLRYEIAGINFTSYGASFVYLNEKGRPHSPLYNYMKPLPEKIKSDFLGKHFENSETKFATETSSPFMGMLNSGLQLYWLKYSKPALWQRTKYALHLPQYLSHLFSGNYFSDYTSIGCHTGLWDQLKNNYHDWVFTEGLTEKLAPLSINTKSYLRSKDLVVGMGLHDSSAALVPYTRKYETPFLLISTGTWCINLNPYNQIPLTKEELQKDCLTFLQSDGQSVKSSRILLGLEHDFQTKRIASHFLVKDDFYKVLIYEDQMPKSGFTPSRMEGTGPQPEKQEMEWDLSGYKDEKEAYVALMVGLCNLLKESICLIDSKTIDTFFVDGGFAANPFFLGIMRKLFPDKNFHPASFPQASALGALLSLE
jgi:sugar (pentulose or hexulose) kinase